MLDQQEDFLLDCDLDADGDHGADSETDRRLLCLAACSICAQTCSSFVEANPVPDEEAALARSVRLAEDCADICNTTWRFLVRGSDQDLPVTHALVEACAAAAHACRIECERHATTSRASASCAAASWVCAEACSDLAVMLAS